MTKDVVVRLLIGEGGPGWALRAIAEGVFRDRHPEEKAEAEAVKTEADGGNAATRRKCHRPPELEKAGAGLPPRAQNTGFHARTDSELRPSGLRENTFLMVHATEFVVTFRHGCGKPYSLWSFRWPPPRAQ